MNAKSFTKSKFIKTFNPKIIDDHHKVEVDDQSTTFVIRHKGKGSALNFPSHQPISRVALSTTWKFAVDYNDHFETPQIAYEDLQPILQCIANALNKPIEDLIIYDPYFCQGGMIQMLKSLGFRNVINENRDFYADIKNNKIPGMVIIHHICIIFIDIYNSMSFML